MPTNKFNLLSEREKEYLKSPDKFDSQTKAEITYRIRQKYEEISNDLSLLKDNSDLWTKKTQSDYIHTKYAPIVCRDCGKVQIRNLYQISHTGGRQIKEKGWILVSEQGHGTDFNYENNLEKTYEYYDFVNDWEEFGEEKENLKDTSINNGISYLQEKYGGFCQDCQIDTESIERVKDTGMAPCMKDDCTVDHHQVNSKPFTEHREYIPIPLEEIPLPEKKGFFG